MPDLDRRTFLRSASPSSPPSRPIRQVVRPPHALGPTHPGGRRPDHYDVNWVDYSPHPPDAACLSAGGCVAYPTKVPLHYRSQWLGNRVRSATS
jgi:hypothetical protein